MKSLIDDSKFIATKIKYSINLFYYCLNDIIVYVNLKTSQ